MSAASSDNSDDSSSSTAERGSASRLEPLRSTPGLQWCLYPAYGLAVVGGGMAAHFAVESPEWSVGPVVLAWLVLLSWHWLYSVGVRYHRPILRYLALTADLAMGGLLTAFALERAAPQLVASGGEAALRGLVVPLIGSAIATGLSTGLIVVHLLAVGSLRS